jgi:hypothetical protein
MKAWIENNTVRDVCHSDPTTCYHPDIAAYYDTDVPNGTVGGATLIGGVWTNPVVPEPDPAPAPPPPATIPATVTMRQARLALHAAGLLATVTQAVAAAGPEVQIEWEYAATVDRTWPTMLVLQSALGLTDAQIDALFIAAAAL